MHIPRPALSSFKVCRSCKERKRFTEFNISASCRYGINAKCKSCKAVIDDAWRNANIDKWKASRKKRRELKGDVVREEIRIWKKKNKERVNAINANRRAQKVGAEGKHTAADMAKILLSQKGLCANPWCRIQLKEPNRHKDHRIPLKLGGSNDKSNMQWLCIPCNLAKSASHPVDFAQRHGYLL